MRRLFRRLRAAPLAVAAAAALTLAWLALRGPRPAKAVLFFVTRRRWLLSPAGTASPEPIAAVVGFVADRHPLRPRCFERSLAVCLLLGRRSEAAMVIGVRRTSDGLSAHAWIPALATSADESHLPLARLTADGWVHGSA
jgi:hypothetical protein